MREQEEKNKYLRYRVNLRAFSSAQDRPTELIPKLRGVLTNPNCEFYPNFVAIHTLATWCKAIVEGGQRDVEMGEQRKPTFKPPF